MARLSDYSGAPKTPKPIVPSAAQLEAKRLQEEAAMLLSQAKTGASTLATQLGAQVDPKTGKIITSTIDPIKAAQFNATQVKAFTPVVTDPNATANAAAAAAAAAAKAAEEEAKRRAGQSAFDLLRSQFDLYGLGDLISPLQDLITEGISAAEMTLKLRNDPKYNKAYKIRFAANDARIAKGLRALSEAEYIGLEDQYQNIMRNYGLPESYYARGQYGKQPGFEKFIAGDVSAAELEDRIQTAQNRVINAAPQVSDALKKFYPEITNGDILAYVLDPENSLGTIKRKVTISEIGGAAFQKELGLDVTRASELARYGVTGETAKQGFGVIAGGLERGRQLSKLQQGPEYTQAIAESEVFALPEAEKARRMRQEITKKEASLFAGGPGITGGALSRERAGGF